MDGRLDRCDAAARLRPHGSLFLNVGAKPTDPWTAMDVAQTARPHLQLQNTIHWIKSIAIDKESAGAAADLDRSIAVGHYKPINSDRFVNDCHEFIFHFTPAGTHAARSEGHRRQVSGRVEHLPLANGRRHRRCRGNTWFIPYDTIQSRDKDRPHPATFPPRIPEYCLRLHGLSRVGVVLDPFLGLGSTAVAAAHRIHATLERDEGGQFWFTPKGRNPTLINGQEVPREQRTPVSPDNKIEVCSFTLRIQPQ